MRHSPPRLLLLLLLVLATPGCGIGLRGGVAPTVDTNGHFGVQLYVGSAMGLADAQHGRGLLLSAHGETSYLSDGQGPTVALVAGPDLEVLGPISWRAGLRGGVGTSFQTHDTFRFFGMSAAVIPKLRDGRSWTRGFGGEVRALYVGGDEWEDAAQLSLGIVYEAYAIITDLKVIP